MSKRGNRGHYCRVCGEIKANEKFSGTGHRNNICKKCASLPINRRTDSENRIIDFDLCKIEMPYEYNNIEYFNLTYDTKDEVYETNEEEELPFT